jgi:hypothetical protein
MISFLPNPAEEVAAVFTTFHREQTRGVGLAYFALHSGARWLPIPSARLRRDPRAGRFDGPGAGSVQETER